MLAAGVVVAHTHYTVMQSRIRDANASSMCHGALLPLNMWCAAQMQAERQDNRSPTRWPSAAAGLSYPSACAMQTLPSEWPCAHVVLGPLLCTLCAFQHEIKAGQVTISLDRDVYSWDFDALQQQFLQPVISALQPLMAVVAQSQVLYYTAARVGAPGRRHVSNCTSLWVMDRGHRHVIKRPGVVESYLASWKVLSWCSPRIGQWDLVTAAQSLSAELE